MNTTAKEAIERALMGPYARVLRKDEDGTFAAEVLEFPGCLTSGDTADEAMANLDEAIEGWVETLLESGEDLPTPLSDREYSGRLTLRLLPSLHRQAATLAQSENVSLNRWLAAAIAHYAGMGPKEWTGPNGWMDLRVVSGKDEHGRPQLVLALPAGDAVLGYGDASTALAYDPLKRELSGNEYPGTRIIGRVSTPTSPPPPPP